MPVNSGGDYWTDKLLSLCERAARFIVAKYESNPTLAPERLWDDYLLDCFPTKPYTHLEPEERDKARLEDIRTLVEWSETIRTPDGQILAVPGLLEQVNKFGVSELVPRQVFMTLAASDLRPASGTRILVHQPSTVARQYASAICGETYQPEATAMQPPVEKAPTQRLYSRAPAPPTELSGQLANQAVLNSEDARNSRMRATITSLSAVRRMEAHLEARGIGLTEFAIQAQTTDRTLRAFRKTGKVRRDIFDNISKAMGMSKEALLKD